MFSSFYKKCEIFKIDPTAAFIITSAVRGRSQPLAPPSSNKLPHSKSSQWFYIYHRMVRVCLHVIQIQLFFFVSVSMFKLQFLLS